MEGWNDGRVEGWKDGRDGRMEGWNDGRMGFSTPEPLNLYQLSTPPPILPIFQYSGLNPLFQHSIIPIFQGF